MSEESPTNQSTESSALQTPSSFHVVNASPTQTSTNTIPQSTLDNFWQKTLDEIKNLTNSDFKNQELPLARIKKIMKLDDDVKVMVRKRIFLFDLLNLFCSSAFFFYNTNYFRFYWLLVKH